MTFVTNIPNAAQSPGLFPPQNNTNFARLKTIINADHIFNDTGQSTDGFHRQMTMVVRDQPVALPTGGNAILYNWLDAGGQAQLRYYNGANDYQITPIAPAPTKVTGIVALAGGALSGVVYTVPSNSFGTIFVNYTTPNAGNFWRYYMFYRSASFLDLALQDASNNTGRPDVEITTSELKIRNGSSSARNVAYYIIVESV
jgi:hypothetical protein